MATTEEIKSWLDHADAAEAKHADPLRWQAAEAIATEIGAGRTANYLAKALDRSPSYVSRYKWIWKYYGPTVAKNRPTFREAELESKSENKPGKRSYTRRVSPAESQPKKTSHQPATVAPVLRPDFSKENVPEPLDRDLRYFLVSTSELIALDYEEAVGTISDDEWAKYREWATELDEWLELFSKALERRFGSDDPVLDE